MPVEYIQCGPMEIKSEIDAKGALLNELNKPSRFKYTWYVLANLFFTDRSRRTTNEIDFLLISPFGVQLVEVKGWDKEILDQEPETVSDQCGILSLKSRRFASLLQSKGLACGYVKACMLLTKSPAVNSNVDGVPIFGLREIAKLVDEMGSVSIEPDVCARIVSMFKPETIALKKGRFTRIGEVDLHPYDITKGTSIHRVLAGRHTRQGVEVDVHLFDFSAAESEHEKKAASREAESLVSLSKQPGVPRLIDGFQNVPQYPREIYYYCVERVNGTPISEKIGDQNWSHRARIDFCLAALTYLEKLHRCNEGNFIHRKITPVSLLVDSNGLPCFTEFSISRHGVAQTISPYVKTEFEGDWIAPEIRSEGLGAASQASDVFSLCSCLFRILPEEDEKCSFVAEILREGMNPSPDKRSSLPLLLQNIENYLRDEDSIKHFNSLSAIAIDDLLPMNGRTYQVIKRLGSGGYSTAYQVCDKSFPGATYCAKIYHNRNLAQEMCMHNAKIRSLSAGNGLQTIFDVSLNLDHDKIHLLCKFVDGQPLSTLIGTFAEYCNETLGEEPTAVIKQWCIELLEKISPLHAAGWVHGDISDSNVLLADGKLWIIDLDSVVEHGESHKSPGTPNYTTRSQEHAAMASASDDVFAIGSLLATLITGTSHKDFVTHVKSHSKQKTNGASDLSWISDFVQKALSIKDDEPFLSAEEALTWISLRVGEYSHPTESDRLSTLCKKLYSQIDRVMEIEHRIREVVRFMGCAAANDSLSIGEEQLIDEACIILEMLCESDARNNLLPGSDNVLLNVAIWYSELVADHLVSKFGIDVDGGQQTEEDITPENTQVAPIQEVETGDAKLWLRLARWAKINQVFSNKARQFLYDYGKSLTRNWKTSDRQNEWAKSLLQAAVAKGFEK